ncbi:MAG TPA: helix-turn-helix domain-containing protein [Candidatus Dormibacteraeota bacterium]|nr:helix-turn-helix domain-containing protein [Candidatus Dormibacteraeota bacterium]
MVTLEQVLDSLGVDVLRPLAAPQGLQMPVSALSIFDPDDPTPAGEGTVVLGIGLRPDRDLRQVMERLAEQGAVLAIKVPAGVQARLAADAESLGLTVLAVAPGAAWVHLVALLRSVMESVPGERSGERLGGAAAGDLFAVANAVAALVDAPVTIEDAQSRVLAYSGRQDEADEARKLTILGRQIPEAYYRRFQRDGVYRRLSSSREPLYLDSLGPDVLPRVAVGVTAGDEVLGSIWAAVRTRPSDAQMRELAEAASFVAIHLLRHRLAVDVQRSLHTDLVAVVINGGSLAADAAGRLGLVGEGFRVLAVGLRPDAQEDNELALLRAWDTLSMHLSVVHRRAASGLVQGVVYAVLPAPSDPAQSRRAAEQAAEGFLARIPAPRREQLIVAAGGHAADLVALPQSRRDADRVLRVLGSRTPRAQSSVGAIDDLRLQVLLLRLAELADEESISETGPLHDLVEHDRRHRTHHVATLRAYLDCFGDVLAAARSLGVHHNTYRYRLQKLRQLPGIDLDDPDQRLALMLQLRLT